MCYASYSRFLLCKVPHHLCLTWFQQCLWPRNSYQLWSALHQHHLSPSLLSLLLLAWLFWCHSCGTLWRANWISSGSTQKWEWVNASRSNPQPKMGNGSQLENAFHLLEKQFWHALHIFFRRFPWYLASTTYNNSKFTQCVPILTFLLFCFKVDDTQKRDQQFSLRKEHNSWPPCHEVLNFRQWHLWEKRTYQKFWKFIWPPPGPDFHT